MDTFISSSWWGRVLIGHLEIASGRNIQTIFQSSGSGLGLIFLMRNLTSDDDQCKTTPYKHMGPKFFVSGDRCLPLRGLFSEFV
jgi:hypothetical protein